MLEPQGKRYLTRDELLRRGLRERDVRVEQWDATVRLRSLTVGAVQRIMQADQQGKINRFELGLMALIESMIEPKLDAGDLPALIEQDADIMAFLSNEALALSGMSDRRQAVQAAEGN